jgi:hypothetical protein
MLRPLLWRLGFEIANVRRAIANKPSQSVLYFAFGGNLDPATLKRRKITPLSEEMFVLRDFKLEFARPGPFKGMGFASVASEAGSIVVGKLLELSSEDSKRLDYYELVPVMRHYKRIYCQQDGKSFFFYQTTKHRSGLRPTENYKKMLLNGYKDLPNVDATFLKSIEMVEHLTELKPSDELEFVLPQIKWAPKTINEQLASLDRVCLQIFMKHLLNRSVTEVFINE